MVCSLIAIIKKNYLLKTQFQKKKVCSAVYSTIKKKKKKLWCPQNSLFKVGKNKLKWTKLLFCLSKSVKCPCGLQNIPHKCFISFSDLFFIILNMSILSIFILISNKAHSQRNTGTWKACWHSMAFIFPGCEKKAKNLYDIAASSAKTQCLHMCTRGISAHVRGPPVCSTAFLCCSSWESRGGLQTRWRLPWLEEDLSFRRTKIPWSSLSLASQQTRNGRGGET